MIYLLGLGSNLGRRAANLARARRWLELKGVRILRASSTYETEPVDHRDQPWFLNQALEVRTALGPRELLGLVKSIEAQMKRSVGVPKGPRVIDIDILLAGDLVLETPDLVIPHARLHLRNFALIPLAEIAPRRRHPVLGRTLGALARASSDPAEVKVRRSPRPRPGLFTDRDGPQMRGPRGEAVLFGAANPENEADGAGSLRPKGKTPNKKRDGKTGRSMNKPG